MENSVFTALSSAFLISVSLFVASSPLGFVAFVKATLLYGLMLLFPKKSSIFREPWKRLTARLVILPLFCYVDSKKSCGSINLLNSGAIYADAEICHKR